MLRRGVLLPSPVKVPKDDRGFADILRILQARLLPTSFSQTKARTYARDLLASLIHKLLNLWGGEDGKNGSGSCSRSTEKASHVRAVGFRD